MVVVKDSMNNKVVSVNNYIYEDWVKKYPEYQVKLQDLYVESSWRDFFDSQTKKDYFKKINSYLSHCLSVSNGKVKIYPYPDLVFNALNKTSFDEVKTVILGQDPYINNLEKDGKIVPQAMGLSFSVPNGVKLPPSLVNIFKNLLEYNHLSKIPDHGNLSFWAGQGCLLLNTSLTVQHGYSNSHAKYWKSFTDSLIKYISDNKENVVFVLWGRNAYSKHSLIDDKKHKMIVSSHPSPLSVDKKMGTYNSFKETDHFSKINKYLKKKEKTEIVWRI